METHLLNLLARIDQINLPIFSSLLTHNFFDPAVLIGTENILSSILSQKNIDLITDNFSSLFLLDENSVQGYAFSASFKSLPNQFLIKASHYPQDRNTRHEYQIGQILNKLRLEYQIYNFAYSFGLFTCAGPIIADRKVLLYCDQENPREKTYYLINEYIPQAKSLYHYLLDKQPGQSEILNIFLQVLFALEIAQKEFNFTHYDLHIENVLIRTLPHTVNLPYRRQNLTTDKLAVIIDYGLSYINTPNYTAGVDDPSEDKVYQKAGIRADKIFPMHDVFKFLADMLRVVKHYNLRLYERLKYLLEFFPKVKENIDQQIIDLYKPEHYIPEEIEEKTIEDYIRFLFQHKKFNRSDLNYQSFYPILACEKNCLTLSEYYQKVGFNFKEKIVGVKDLNLWAYLKGDQIDYEIKVKLHYEGDLEQVKAEMGKNLKKIENFEIKNIEFPTSEAILALNVQNLRYYLEQGFIIINLSLKNIRWLKSFYYLEKNAFKREVKQIEKEIAFYEQKINAFIESVLRKQYQYDQIRLLFQSREVNLKARDVNYRQKNGVWYYLTLSYYLRRLKGIQEELIKDNIS